MRGFGLECRAAQFELAQTFPIFRPSQSTRRTGGPTVVKISAKIKGRAPATLFLLLDIQEEDSNVGRDRMAQNMLARNVRLRLLLDGNLFDGSDTDH